MGCRVFLQFLIRLSNVVTGTIGLMMIVFSLWMWNDWTKHHHPPPPPPPSLPLTTIYQPSADSPIEEAAADVALEGRWLGDVGATDGGWALKGDRIGVLNGSPVAQLGSNNIAGTSVRPAKGRYRASPNQEVEGHIVFPDIPKLDFKKLPAAWFIYAFLGAGIFTFLVAFLGLIATDCYNDCCLCLYIFGLVLLVAGHAMLVAAVITDKHLDRDIPQDPTGEVEKTKEYVLNHKKICMILMDVVLGSETLSLILAIILKMAYGGRRRWWRGGSSKARQDQLLPEVQTDVVAAPFVSAPPAGYPAGGTMHMRDFSVESEYERLPQQGEAHKMESVSHRVTTPSYDSIVGKTAHEAGTISRQSPTSTSPRALPTDGVVLVTRRVPRLVRDSIWVLNNHDVTIRVCLHTKKHDWCYHKEEINPGCARAMSCSSLRSVKLHLHLMPVNKRRNIPVYTVILSTFNSSMRPGASANSIMVSLSQVTQWECFNAESRFLYHYSFPGGFKPTVEAVDDPYYRECRILNGTMDAMFSPDGNDSQEDVFENEILTAVEDISSSSQTGDISSSGDGSRPLDPNQWAGNAGKSIVSSASSALPSTSFVQGR